jgi:hypothetical protein
MNPKRQRFITANYGTNDLDFFLFRIAKYFSGTRKKVLAVFLFLGGIIKTLHIFATQL